jgi:hypothetical protein
MQHCCGYVCRGTPHSCCQIENCCDEVAEGSHHKICDSQHPADVLSQCYATCAFPKFTEACITAVLGCRLSSLGGPCCSDSRGPCKGQDPPGHGCCSFAVPAIPPPLEDIGGSWPQVLAATCVASNPTTLAYLHARWLRQPGPCVASECVLRGIPLLPIGGVGCQGDGPQPELLPNE